MVHGGRGEAEGIGHGVRGERAQAGDVGAWEDPRSRPVWVASGASHISCAHHGRRARPHAELQLYCFMTDFTVLFNKPAGSSSGGSRQALWVLY